MHETTETEGDGSPWGWFQIGEEVRTPWGNGSVLCRNFSFAWIRLNNGEIVKIQVGPVPND